LGEENVDPDARGAVDRLKGLSRDPEKRKKLADMIRNRRADQGQLEEMAGEAGLDAEAVKGRIAALKAGPV
jgi:hypothetical protein